MRKQGNSRGRIKDIRERGELRKCKGRLGNYRMLVGYVPTEIRRKLSEFSEVTVTAQCRRSYSMGFWPKESVFVLPFLFVPRAFSEKLSVRELRTQSQNKQAQR